MATSPSATTHDTTIDLPSLSATIRRAVAPPIQFLGFWAAVSLPFLYVPLLSGGLAETELTVFLGLLSAHVAALFVGHGYRRDEQ